MITVGKFLESIGKSYPKPDCDDGGISGQAFQDAGLPMVVACTCCEMTMVLTPDRPCDADGAIYWRACAGAT